MTTSPGEGIYARFDDFAPGGHSFELLRPSEEFVAHEAAEVADVLHSAEQAAESNRWVAGFVTYEAAPGLDPSLPALEWPKTHPLSDLPLAWFAAFERREEVQRGPATHNGEDPQWCLDRPRQWHRESVQQVQEAIAAGSYYQLNLTARLVGEVKDAFLLYRKLSVAQRGRHNALIVTPDYTIISASPELFFSFDGSEIVTRPMKGTASRGRGSDEDLARAQALQTSPKERAENVMIVDLVRNDLGRIAEFGSVRVENLFEAEQYPSVWQLTSTISARLRKDTKLTQLFGALFPSGSITGAPKRAAMQAIAEIEKRPRGMYCGAIGYLQPELQRPTARFSVAIRTITQENRTGYAEYGTGGAITSSSKPDDEWAELLSKTVVLDGSIKPCGLIETFRFEPPESFVNLARHLARMRASASYFSFPFDVDAITDELTKALEKRGSVARVRILLEAAGHVRVQVEDLNLSSEVVNIGLADVPVSSGDILLFHKHADRSRYEHVRWTHRALDDVVLWNEYGQVTEATTANLAVFLDDQWWTPSLGCGLLPGVERGRLLEDNVIVERELTIDEVKRAPKLALINSLRGWRAAKLV